MEALFVLISLLVAALIYFLPAVVAHRRGHANSTAIMVLNLFLGWTLVGWVAALVWAFTTGQAKAVEILPPARESLRQPGPAVRPSSTSAERECPWCAEPIKAAARVCKHCSREVEPLAAVAPSPQEVLAAQLGIVYSEEADRYIWRRDYFKSLDDAIAYAQKNS